MSRRAEIRLASLSLLAAAAVLAAPPAAAQFSDSYSFLQAVEKRDGDKATSLLTDHDTRVINTRNHDTGETALAIVAKRRDLPWLRFLLGKDSDPSIAHPQGMHPLVPAPPPPPPPPPPPLPHPPHPPPPPP